MSLPSTGFISVRSSGVLPVFAPPTVLHLQRQDDELCHHSGLLPRRGRRSEVTPSLRRPAPPLGSLLLGASSSGRRGDSTAPPASRVDSHGSGGPSAAAQNRDLLAAPWLDLTLPRAGGLSSKVSLPALLGWMIGSGGPSVLVFWAAPTTIAAQFHAIADKASHVVTPLISGAADSLLKHLLG